MSETLMCKCGHGQDEHDGGGPEDPHHPTCEHPRCRCEGWEPATPEPREAPRPDPESRIVWPPWMCRLVETRSVFPAGLGRCLRVEDITAAMEAEEARAAAAPREAPPSRCETCGGVFGPTTQRALGMVGRARCGKCGALTPAAPREAPARDYPIADAETWRLAYGEKCESLDKAEALLAAARERERALREALRAVIDSAEEIVVASEEGREEVTVVHSETLDDAKAALSEEGSPRV